MGLNPLKQRAPQKYMTCEANKLKNDLISSVCIHECEYECHLLLPLAFPSFIPFAFPLSFISAFTNKTCMAWHGMADIKYVCR